MFLDEIRSQKREAKIQYTSRRAIRMPQILVLIGEFTAEESRLLETNMKQYFPEEYMNWMCMGETAITSSNIQKFEEMSSIEDGDILERRAAFARLGQEEVGKAFCGQAAAELFNATASTAYVESGKVYAAVICKANQAQAGILIPFAEQLKKSLKSQFSSVQMDLYLLLDQQAYWEQQMEREAAVYLSLQNADWLVENKTLDFSYILSNMNSKEKLLDEQLFLNEAYMTIPLLMAMKNMVPENEAYRYGDTDFRRAVKGVAESGAVVGSGRFSSAGYLHLQADREFMRLAAYLTVWRKMESRLEEKEAERLIRDTLECEAAQIRDAFAPVGKGIFLSEEDFDAIVREREVDEAIVYTGKIEKVIGQFFGKNLDLFYELNVRSCVSEQAVKDWYETLQKKISTLPGAISAVNISDVLEHLEKSLTKLADENMKFLEQKQQEFLRWKTAPVSKYVKGGKKEKPLFMLAVYYLQKKNEMYRFSMQKEIYEQLLKLIREGNTSYRRFKETALENIREIEAAMRKKVISAQDQLGRLQTANAEAYYTEVTAEKLREYAAEFQRLTTRIRVKIADKEMAEREIYQEISAFCENYIFCCEEFRREFLEELQNRLIGYGEIGGWHIRKKEDVSEFLLKTIVNSRHTLFRDYIGQGFHNYGEMCLFLSDDSMFQGDGWDKRTTKLFCDTGGNSLNVVFLAGCLDKENLYRWSKYEESYRKYKELTKNA